MYFVYIHCLLYRRYHDQSYINSLTETLYIQIKISVFPICLLYHQNLLLNHSTPIKCKGKQSFTYKTCIYCSSTCVLWRKQFWVAVLNNRTFTLPLCKEATSFFLRKQLDGQRTDVFDVLRLQLFFWKQIRFSSNSSNVLLSMLSLGFKPKCTCN